MDKFYKYLLPIILLVIAFGVSTFLNNEFVLFAGWVISLIWLNRVAFEFQDKFVKILTIILLSVTIIFFIVLLFGALEWSSG